MKKKFCRHCLREVIPGAGCIPPAMESTDFFEPCNVCNDRQTDEETVEFDTDDPVKSLCLLDNISVVEGYDNPPIIRIIDKEKTKSMPILRIICGFFLAVLVFALIFTEEPNKYPLLIIMCAFVGGFICLIEVSIHTAGYIRFFLDHFEYYYGSKKTNIPFKSAVFDGSFYIKINRLSYQSDNSFYLTVKKDFSSCFASGLSLKCAKFIKTYIEFYYQADNKVSANTSTQDKLHDIPTKNEVNSSSNDNRFVEFD